MTLDVTMLAVVGELIPLGVAVAVSPLALAVVLLVLMSENAKATSVGFLCGWTTGIVGAVTAFTLLSSILPERVGDPRPAIGIAEIILGILLLALAVRQARAPTRATDEAGSGWIGGVQTTTRGLGLGMALMAINVKNLLMCAAAGIAIRTSGLSVAQEALAITVFTVLAASSVAIPVIAYAVSPDRWREPLRSLREWLVRNNTTVTTVLLVVLAAVLVGRGLDQL